MSARVRPLAIAAAFSVGLSTAHAQIYSCQVGNKKIFSDQPCSADAQTLEVRPGAIDPLPTGANEAAMARIKAIDAENARQGHRRAVRDSQYAIESAQRAIAELNAEMDHELAELRRQSQLTTNDIEGAARRLALSNEMEAVARQYQNKMVVAADRLQQLRAQHARLVANPPTSHPQPSAAEQ